MPTSLRRWNAIASVFENKLVVSGICIQAAPEASADERCAYSNASKQQENTDDIINNIYLAANVLNYENTYHMSVATVNTKSCTQVFKAVHLRKMFELNITPESIAGSIIILGARWVVKNGKFKKVYT